MTDILEIKLEGVEQLASASQNLNKTVESIVRLQEQLKDLAEKQYARQVATAEAREKAAEAREAGRPERERLKQEREEEKRIRAEERKAREEKKRLLKDESEALKKEREAKKYFESLQRQSMLGRKPPTDPGAYLSALYRPTLPSEAKDSPEIAEAEEEKAKEIKSSSSALKFFTGAIKMAWDGVKKFVDIMKGIFSWWTKSVAAMMALSEKLVRDMRISRLAGTDVQAPKYLSATLGQYANTDQIISALAESRQQPANKGYTWFKQEQGLTGNEPGTEQAYQAMLYARRLMEKFAGAEAWAYEAFDLKSLGMPLETTMSLPPVEEMQKQHEKAAGAKKLTSEEESKFRDFISSFHVGLTDIETTLAKAILNNIGPLKELGSTVKGVIETMAGDKNIADLFKQMTDAIRDFVEKAGKKENVDRFTKAISSMVSLSEKLVSVIEPMAEAFLKLYKVIEWINKKLGWAIEKADEYGKVYGEFESEGKRSREEQEKGYKEYIQSKEKNGIAKSIDEMVPSPEDFYRSIIGYLGVGPASTGQNEKMSYGKAEQESDMLLRVLSKIANQRPQGVRVEFAAPQASSNMNVQLTRIPGAVGGAPFGGRGIGSPAAMTV